MSHQIVTVAERDAAALATRKAAITNAELRLVETASKYGGHYRVFGSAAKDEIHMLSDLDVLAEFPKATTNDAICAAEAICWELELPCDIIDRRMCSDEFLNFALPGSRKLE